MFARKMRCLATFEARRNLQRPRRATRFLSSAVTSTAALTTPAEDENSCVRNETGDLLFKIDRGQGGCSSVEHGAAAGTDMPKHES